MTRAVCVYTRERYYGEPALQIRTNTVSAQERGEREEESKSSNFSEHAVAEMGSRNSRQIRVRVQWMKRFCFQGSIRFSQCENVGIIFTQAVI